MMIFPRRLPLPDPSSYCHQQQQQSLLEQKERLMAELEEENNKAKETTEVVVENGPKKLQPTLDQHLMEIDSLYKANKKSKVSIF